MHFHFLKGLLQHPPSTAKAVALIVLLTAAATWLWAHEGHQPLPTKGAQVDAAKGQVNLSSDARNALGVTTEEVGLQSVEERLTLPAVLMAPWQKHAYVTTRLPGKITAVHVQPGQMVSQGQPLAEVQSVELENLQLELLQAHNDALLSAENLKHLEASVRQGAVPDKSVLELVTKNMQNKNDLEIARRRLSGLGVEDAFLERLLNAAAKPLTTLSIKSPIAGVVTRTEVRVGQVVDLADHLFEVVDLSSVWVKMDVLEKDLSRIELGQPVEIHLAPYPTPGEVFHSTVLVKGLSLDPKTRQGTVWSELSNPNGQGPRFLPGMYGQADIILSSQKKKVTVPAAALINHGAERFVLLEEGPGQYVRQNIVVGLSTPEIVEVRSGQLVPGDRVMTVGSHELATFFEQGVLRLSPQAAKNIGLQVEAAQHRSIGEVVQISGAVDLPLDHRAIASARLPGSIHRILIDRDQVVRPGDVLAEVNSLEFQNLQLELLRNHLQLQLLDQALQRLRSIEGVVPPRQLREAESAYRTTLQRQESYRRKLEAVGISEQQIQDVMERKKFMEAMPVKTPIGGAVVRLYAGLGHSVKAEDPLFEIHDITHLVVRGFVSERQVARVRVGQLARIRLLADPKTVAEATVVRSAQAFGDDDRTLSVWLEVKDHQAGQTGPLWLQGMLTRSTVVISESEATLAVPKEAVLREGTQAYLFVQKADGSFERRQVETGRSDDSFVAITRGLREGEIVVIRGVPDLQTAYVGIK